MKRKQLVTHWESIITAIVADYNRLDAACDAALKAGAMDPNGELHEAIWRAFENMLARIDVNGWISWFIYDNECGKKAFAAGINGRSRPIRTPRQLAALIAGSLKSE